MISKLFNSPNDEEEEKKHKHFDGLSQRRYLHTSPIRTPRAQYGALSIQFLHIKRMIHNVNEMRK